MSRDGVVTLFGMVSSEAAKQAASENARKVSGVNDVRNQLRVVSDERRGAVEASDQQIERDVQRSRDENASLDAGNVAAVEGGVVRLTGNVGNEDDRFAAGFAARSVPGVRAVMMEDLRVPKSG